MGVDDETNFDLIFGKLIGGTMNDIPKLQRDSITHVGTIEVSAYVDFDHDPEDGDRPIEEIEAEFRELLESKLQEIDEQLDGASVSGQGKYQRRHQSTGSLVPKDMEDTVYVAMSRGTLGRYWSRNRTLRRSILGLEQAGVDRQKLSEAIPESDDVRVIKVTAHDDADGLDLDDVYVSGMGGVSHPWGAETEEVDLSEHEYILEDI